MGIKMLTCPKCGGNLEIKEDKRLNFCPYCGTQIEYDDGSTAEERIEKEKIKADTDKIKEKFNFELKKDAISIIKDLASEWSMVGTFIVLMAAMWIIVSCSSGFESDKPQIEGGVTVKNHSSYIGKNYQVVESELESLGFKNIKTIDLEDANILNKENTIDEISINGDEHFGSDDVFDPEHDTVIISYH